MRILIADDDPVSLSLLSTLVTRAGHEAITCRDGRDALAIFEHEGAPRLAIVDWVMPVLDGPSFCRKVRQLPRSRQPHVVLLTSLSDEASVLQGLEAGADEYLVKPLRGDQLRARVAAWARSLESEPAGEDEATGHDAPPPPPVARGPKDLSGHTIDHKYAVLARVGVGGMGAVYRARHALLGETVALKVIHRDLSADPKTRERFLREARAMLKFVHPNAIPVRDCGLSADGILYMTLGFSNGRTLRAVLAEEKSLPVARALSLARQCLLAIGEAHSHGIVHRDLKPENIMIEGQGTPRETARICDFGIAKILAAPEPKPSENAADISGNHILGTPHYMSPEQATGDVVDARSDIYSMGCILYEMLSATRVFPHSQTVFVLMSHVRERPEPLSKRIGGIPPRLEALVAKMLAKSAAERPQTAAEVIEAIDALGPLHASRPLEVLLAEDNLVSQRLTKRMLEKWGHRVTVVADGQEAVRLAAERAFDAILMDGDMPVQDGFGATARIRERERGGRRRVPIIALTAYDGEEDRKRCLAAGMDDYVPKPFEPHRLFRAVEAAVARAAEEAEAEARGERVFDGTVALARVDGDSELLREIAGAFVREAPRLVKEMRCAIDANDGKALARAAHELKGSAGTCSANVVAAISARIEKHANDSNLAGAAECAVSLEKELRESLELLGGVAAS